MKRNFDLLSSIILVILLSFILLITYFLVRITSSGPGLFWSDRVGQNNKIFRMPKFRTMVIDTPVVATDLLIDPYSRFTPIGSFLRKYSIDELPQLWCVIKGEMSLVGPRPALYNQYKLIKLRTKKNIHFLCPGVTGWAQVNGRDDRSIEEKVVLDYEYLKRKNFIFDIKILYLTFFRVLRSKGIAH
jgi:O-antigen biosynthesis protein WbqP